MNQIYESKSLHKQSRDVLRYMCHVLPQVSADRLEKGLVFEAVCTAVKRGIVEFVSEILAACPDFSMLCREKSTQRNMIMIAVLHRQKQVFNYIYSFNAKKSITANNSLLAAKDNKGNSILHIAAMFESSATSNRVPGAAFLMQSERQWFKVISLTLYVFNIISVMSCFWVFIFIFIFLENFNIWRLLRIFIIVSKHSFLKLYLSSVK